MKDYHNLTFEVTEHYFWKYNSKSFCESNTHSIMNDLYSKPNYQQNNLNKYGGTLYILNLVQSPIYTRREKIRHSTE